MGRPLADRPIGGVRAPLRREECSIDHPKKRAVLDPTQVVLSGSAADLRENELTRQAYLGELKVA
jgi:hypothetical protein